MNPAHLCGRTILRLKVMSTSRVLLLVAEAWREQMQTFRVKVGSLIYLSSFLGDDQDRNIRADGFVENFNFVFVRRERFV